MNHRRLHKAHGKYLDLKAAYDELAARGVSPALRLEMLDIVSDAHRDYYRILTGTLAAAAAGVIPERRTA